MIPDAPPETSAHLLGGARLELGRQRARGGPPRDPAAKPPVGRACPASYYLLTGVWPPASLRTFQLVTGPKSDFWLAQTAGAFIAVIGGAVATAAGKRLVDKRRFASWRLVPR